MTFRAVPPHCLKVICKPIRSDAVFDNLFVVGDGCCSQWKRPSNGCYSPIWGGVLACLVLWPVSGATPSEQAPESAPAKRYVVDAPSGKVEGQQDGKMLVFKGIPYALPPVGQARWKPPTPMSRWAEARKATEFGPACYQPTITVQTIYTRGPLPMSEDCLTLNIWAPVETRNAPGLFLDLRRCVDEHNDFLLG